MKKINMLVLFFVLFSFPAIAGGQRPPWLSPKKVDLRITVNPGTLRRYDPCDTDRNGRVSLMERFRCKMRKPVIDSSIITATPSEPSGTGTPEPPAGCEALNPDALVLNVNSTLNAEDASPGDGACATTAGTCTLRAAVMESNAHTAGGVIVIPAGTYNLTEGGGTLYGALMIRRDTVLCGEDASNTIIDGGEERKIFSVSIYSDSVDTDIHLRARNLTLRKGYGTVGGAVTLLAYSEATNISATFEGIVFTGNVATGNGGAVRIGSQSGGNVTMELNRCTFSSNQSPDGGAIYADGKGSITITNSSFVNNTASINGGAFLLSGNVDATLTNVTLTGNEVAILQGGAFYVTFYSGDFQMINSTVAGNMGYAPGFFFYGLSGTTPPFPTFTIQNSIVDGCNTVGSTEVTFTGGNNIATAVDSNCIGLTTIASSAGLGELVDNGAPGGITLPLLSGSSAINAGNPDYCPATDQLGNPRVGTCDIGAVEFPE